MRKKTAAILRQVLGWLFVLLGLAGLVLPLLQGVILLIIGLYVLSLDSKWFRGKLDFWASKDSRVAVVYQKVDHRIRSIFGMDDATLQ